MTRRTIVLVVVGAVVVVSVILYAILRPTKPLNVANWDFYIGTRTIADFQKATGATVNYTIYASNEEARDRIRSSPGAYDVVFPSDYMMDYLIQNNMLAPISWAQIPNVNPTVIDPSALEEFRRRGWDRYCVPYLFGTTGFAVNNRTVSVPPGGVTWQWLASPKFSGRLIVLDDARQVLGSIMIEQGHDPNSTNPDDLNQAVALLRSLKPKILEFTADTGKDRMLQGVADVAFAWSGDSLQVAAQRPNWSYAVPLAGGIRFQDGVCIPANAPHRELALSFLNFVLTPAVHKDIIETTFYTTTNRGAREMASDRLRALQAHATGANMRMFQLRQMSGAEERAIESAWARVKQP